MEAGRRLPVGGRHAGVLRRVVSGSRAARVPGYATQSTNGGLESIVPACRLCGQQRVLVRAHVIPEAFFRRLRLGGEIPLLVSGFPNVYNQRAPIGVYDKTILCDGCERKFERVDDYAARALLNHFEEWFAPLVHAGRAVGYSSSVVDQELLLRFLVATLWRASVSSRPFFHRVDLGQLEREARAVIERPEERIPSTFAAVLSRWPPPEESGVFAHGLMDPIPLRYDGARAYRLYLGDFIAEIKADRRPFPDGLQELALGTSDELRVVVRDFVGSKDANAMRATAQHAHRRENQARVERARRR